MRARNPRQQRCSRRAHFIAISLPPFPAHPPNCAYLVSLLAYIFGDRVYFNSLAIQYPSCHHPSANSRNDWEHVLSRLPFPTSPMCPSVSPLPVPVTWQSSPSCWQTGPKPRQQTQAGAPPCTTPPAREGQRWLGCCCSSTRRAERTSTGQTRSGTLVCSRFLQWQRHLHTRWKGFRV